MWLINGIKLVSIILIGSQFNSAKAKITFLISAQITIGNLCVDFDYKSVFTNGIYFISP